tara:strand:- start:4370 stop:5401 length:1032 start_codon:yes stop_codon:yes gene_type:complete
LKEAVDRTIERCLLPLDILRWWTFKLSGRWIHPFLRRRELRVAVGGSFMLLVLLGLVLTVPFWMLAIGPILWGVPHVLSDVRYLVVRPGHHKDLLLLVAGGVPLLLVATGTIGVLGGLTAAAGVLIVGEGSSFRRYTGLLCVGVLAYFAWHLGYTASIIFAHAHNFIAVALWWSWRKRTPIHLWPLLLFLLISAGLALGWFDVLLQASTAFVWIPSSLPAQDHLAVLAPGLPTHIGLRLVLLFAFAQGVHYLMWVRLIPEDDRPRPTPRTYAASYRALRDEMGTWIMLLVTCLALFFGAWALFDLAAARLNYLRMAIFHGHLELAAAALLWLKGRDGFLTPPS